MEYNLKRISTAGIPEAIAKAGLYRSSTNRKKPSRSVAISWPSNRSINSPCVCSASLLPISSPAVRPIATGKQNKPSSSSTTPMSGSTTRGFCTNDVQKRSSTLDSHLIYCSRFSNKRCTLSQKRKRLVRRETTMPSFAGIGACACSKIQPTYGMYGKKNALRSLPRTHHRHRQPSFHYQWNLRPRAEVRADYLVFP